uniref:Uncharacterized protein n=1 Tax=Cacopsylla melanoneura TaxID=428564 RepID=A0A8D8S866_9HEMI
MYQHTYNFIKNVLIVVSQNSSSVTSPKWNLYNFQLNLFDYPKKNTCWRILLQDGASNTHDWQCLPSVVQSLLRWHGNHVGLWTLGRWTFPCHIGLTMTFI